MIRLWSDRIESGLCSILKKTIKRDTLKLFSKVWNVNVSLFLPRFQSRDVNYEMCNWNQVMEGTMVGFCPLSAPHESLCVRLKPCLILITSPAIGQLVSNYNPIKYIHLSSISNDVVNISTKSIFAMSGFQIKMFSWCFEQYSFSHNVIVLFWLWIIMFLSGWVATWGNSKTQTTG